jgi:hypothetical protein
MTEIRLKNTECELPEFVQQKTPGFRRGFLLYLLLSKLSQNKVSCCEVSCRCSGQHHCKVSTSVEVTVFVDVHIHHTRCICINDNRSVPLK